MKSTAPKWASDLVREVCASAGKKQPDLVWRTARPVRRYFRMSLEDWETNDEFRRWRDRNEMEILPCTSSKGYRTVAIGKANVKSSGRWQLDWFAPKARIIVTAGTDLHDQKLVLLHELAHHLTKGGHTMKFWKKAWKLYEKHGIDMDYALKREGAYKKKATLAYAKRK